MAESVHCSANRPCNHGRYWSKFRNFGLSLVTFTDYITKMISVALILLSCLGLALSVYQRQSSRSSEFSERLIIIMLVTLHEFQLLTDEVFDNGLCKQ